MNLEEFVGALGATALLFAFFMNQTNRWKNDMFVYDFVNFLASFLLMIYSIALENIIFVVINGVWGFFSLKDVVRKLIKNQQ